MEKLLFCGDVVKIGRFDCPSHHPCFPHTDPLNNNLFVVTHNPLWWRRGEGDYRFAEPGAALLHRAGRKVERRNVQHASDLSDWFGIRTDVFEETLDRYRLHDQNVTERTISVVTKPAFRLTEIQLLTRLQNAELSDLETEESVLALFDHVCRCLSQNQGSTTASVKTRIRRQRVVDRARILLDSLEYESGEMENRLSLSKIANQAGASVYHLCRVFRQECGMSLHAYRQAQRLGLALRLLQSSRQDLTQLALRLGFSSHSHFSRVFRKHFGVAPSSLNASRTASFEPDWLWA